MLICYVRPTLSSGNKMVIEELVIDRNHRGRGLGSMLLKHCLESAKSRGLDCVELACSLAKPELHRFYERAGFKHRMRLYSLFLEHE
jgi:ribosomal protein S18 acetylase RimI-like enzyme